MWGKKKNFEMKNLYHNLCWAKKHKQILKRNTHAKEPARSNTAVLRVVRHLPDTDSRAEAASLPLSFQHLHRLFSHTKPSREGRAPTYNSFLLTKRLSVVHSTISVYSLSRLAVSSACLSPQVIIRICSLQGLLEWEYEYQNCNDFRTEMTFASSWW